MSKCNNCGGIGHSSWGKRVRSTADREKEVMRHDAKQKDDMRPVKPWDLLNKENWTMAEVRAKRLEICGECPELNKIRQCAKCHCFVDMKTKLEDAFCPLRKW